MAYFCMVMRSGRFYVACLVSAGLMYLLFYVFHGILTNDILKSSIPQSVFLSVAAIVYLVIGFAMSILLDAAFFKKEVKSIYTRALIAGPVIAIFLYSVAMVVGLSFSAKFTIVNLLVDLGWQIVEQTVGTIIVAFIKVITFSVDEIEV